MSEKTNPGMPGSPQKSRLWLRVLFGLSLALNLLVVGLVVGAMVRFSGSGGVYPSRSIAAEMLRELPRKERRDLRRHSGGTRAELRARQQANTKALTRALRTVPFDPVAMDAVLQGLGSERAAFVRAVRESWLDRVSGMSDQERLAYADRLERKMTSHSHSRRRNWWRN